MEAVQHAGEEADQFLVRALKFSARNAPEKRPDELVVVIRLDPRAAAAAATAAAANVFSQNPLSSHATPSKHRLDKRLQKRPQDALVLGEDAHGREDDLVEAEGRVWDV